MFHFHCGGGPRGLAAVLLAASLLAGDAAALQKKKGQAAFEEIDPYTGGSAAALERAGYVDLAPIHFVGSQSTKQVKETLGGVPTLFAETKHFRIASTLDSYDLRGKDADRNRLKPALMRLKKRLPKVNAKSRVLDPWLRLHLYAALLEETYANFVASFGLEDLHGPGVSPTGERFYLGNPDKLSILLTNKRSELGRYARKNCRMQSDIQVYEHFEREGVAFLGVSFEGIENNESSLRFMVTYGLVRSLLETYGGRTYFGGALWQAGLARWFARQGNEDLIVFYDPPGAPVNRRKKDTEWRRKVRARVEQDFFPSTEDLLGYRDEIDMKFSEHMMLWSRMDFLMAQDVKQRRAMLEAMSKPLPWLEDQEGYLPQFQERFKQALQAAYGLDLAGLDQAWAKYVKDTYPRR